MGFLSLCYSFLLLLGLLTAATAAYNATDIIRLDCGATTITNSPDQRTWNPDSGSKFMPASNDLSTISTADQQPSSVQQIPYLSARIFPSQFTYSIPLSSGPKFLRLYFYSATYSGRDITKSFFNVSAAGHTLLANFSVYLSSPENSPSFVKEFVVHVGNTQNLQLTFTPTSSVDSYAFINGIEIVSMPDNLYLTGLNSPSTTLVGKNSSFIVDTGMALETLYRLNVGGQSINVQDDTGMFRKWDNDNGFLKHNSIVGKETNVDFTVLYNNRTPAYTAPDAVYTSQRAMGPDQNNLIVNMSWIFSVDSGFSYLLRLHFCEFVIDIDGNNQRVFTVFLGDQIADKSVDVFRRAGGKEIPIFSDYVVSLPVGNDGIPSKQDLSLSLHPNIDSRPSSVDALLSGLEIMKLNKSDGSLAGPNPLIALNPIVPGSNPQSPENRNRKGSSSSVGAIVGGVLGGIAVIAILAFLILKRRRKVTDSTSNLDKSSWINFTTDTSKSSKTTVSILPSDLCRHFSLEEMKLATRNFDKDLVIGSGGFGNVYKGYVDNGSVAVAIKRLNPESKQGAREFQTEIEMLSRLRHLHLVSLIGYCNYGGEMLLVYEYMSHGTLRDHLYKTKNTPLSWKQRLQICIGSARGLHYLHTGAKQGIIHRDVKSTNILLDEKWVAKVSDFGLSKLGPTDLSQTHVTTAVKGSVGYLDPEYYRRQLLTEKSDVYSFGVVLLEVMCGRAAIIAGLPKEQVSLAEWARQCNKKGTVDMMVDPLLDGQIAPECVKKFFEVALNCVRDNGTERPTMGDVVWSLEFAMQLQEAAEKDINEEDEEMGFGHGKVRPLGEPTTSDDSEGMFSVSRSMGASTVEISGRGTDSTTTDQYFKSENVFTEIMDPQGR
ncbi:receptor-like protein kinase FERONIA [Impatiens glandulifera]|uniref:receptor-like protein kinase FERONIA n=1 Tax=Impatiens glandulifera TaxID=253017 RepID=UPI001FB09E0A|nr:receptor-like protein kinase FERONIA [Impatiens glandulifera]